MMLRKMIWLVPILILMAASGLIGFHHTIAASPAGPNHIYATWEGFEADKCASIWLIVRFVDPDAQFKFYPKGTTINSGIAFDTPEAELRRYHNMAAFEAILRRYGLDDPVLIQIGKIIHDIEVNTWQRKRYTETLVIQEEIRKIIEQNPDHQKPLTAFLTYFDALYERLKKKGINEN